MIHVRPFPNLLRWKFRKRRKEDGCRRHIRVRLHTKRVFDALSLLRPYQHGVHLGSPPLGEVQHGLESKEHFNDAAPALEQAPVHLQLFKEVLGHSVGVVHIAETVYDNVLLVHRISDTTGRTSSATYITIRYFA